MAENYGIKVSKIGTDITSTNSNDYSFNSAYPALITLKVATVNYTFSTDIGAGGAEINLFVHGLNEKKLFWTSISGTNGTWNGINSFYMFAPPGFSWFQLSRFGTISMKYFDTGGTHDETNQPWTFKYYLFDEKVRPFV